jgi:MFS family permease
VHRLPIFSSAINSVYGVASVAAPLLGGVFTTQLSWRWCFLINLPFGIGAMAVIVAFIRPGKGNFKLARTPWGLMKQFDIPGLLCFLPGVSSLLIALQWGGVKYSWDNVRIIVLLAVAVLLMMAFLFGQYKFQEAALISPRIARQRSIAFGAFYAFTIGASATVCEYYVSPHPPSRSWMTFLLRESNL